MQAKGELDDEDEEDEDFDAGAAGAESDAASSSGASDLEEAVTPVCGPMLGSDRGIQCTSGGFCLAVCSCARAGLGLALCALVATSRCRRMCGRLHMVLVRWRKGCRELMIAVMLTALVAALVSKEVAGLR